MTWGAAFEALNRACVRTFGDETSAVYTPASGAPFTIQNAIFDQNFRTVDPDTGATISTQGLALFVAKSDLGGHVPDDGDRVTIGAATYVIIDDEHDSAGGIVLRLHKAA